MTPRHGTRWLLVALAFFASAIYAQDATPTPEVDFQAELSAAELAAIEAVEHNVLHRPIELSEDKTHWVDRGYGYGATRPNMPRAHLGVEFVNARNTPVYAAKAGRVVFAGADTGLRLGPQLDYYGNVVVLAHDLYSLAGRRLFTLYAHLEKIDVQAGAYVEDQSRLGLVGSSGVALGPHLHFETRVGAPFDYRQTRNPELWLQHYLEHGMIVGAVRDKAGDFVMGKRLTVRSESISRDVFTYGGGEVNPDPVWQENFVVGDLPADEYEIVLLSESGSIAYRERVQVVAYHTTTVAITLDE